MRACAFSCNDDKIAPSANVRSVLFCVIPSSGTHLPTLTHMKMNQLFRNAVLSALFTLSVSSSFGQPANLTNDVQLWLRADVGVTTNAAGGVSQWSDSSTFANNAVQANEAAAPSLILNALNGRPVLRFDGATDYMDVADSESLSGTGDISSFFVVKFDDFATFRAVWGKTAVNYPAPTDIYAQPGSGFLSVFRGDGTPANVGVVNSGQALRANAYLVLGFSVEGSTLTHYLNNQENGSGAITTNTADGNTALKIGTRSDFATRLKGDLAEVLIFNRALSSLDRSNVFNYLQTKYNLLNLAPSISLATSPTGPQVIPGTEIQLNATANDLDGTIARVDFFSSGTLIGTATQPPYSMRVRVDSAGPIQFTARATDDKAAIANSAPISMTAIPGSTSDLPITAGLQLWLKADAGVTVDGNGGVNQWLDQSGKANHALQIDPNFAPILTNSAISSQPAIRFDGVNDFLEIADSDSISITNDITSFFVLRFADFATFRAVWAKTTGNLPNPTDIYVQPSNRRLRLYRGNGVASSIQPSDATEPFIAGNSMLAGFTIGGNAVNHYFNGLLNGSSTMTVTPTDGNGSLRIGRRADTSTWMKGEIAEIVIYDRALPADERREVERYLAEKYSTPALLERVNDLPNVAITSPSGEILQAPDTFTVSASASDTDGSIVSVQFLANGASLAVDSNAPYAAQLTLPYGGGLTLSAVAIDNLGARRTAASVALCVQGPGRPHGLVGYWPLDGDATAIVGASGIMVSNPVVTLDRNELPGGALAFDGLLQQRVEIPAGGGLNAAPRGSISLWVKWIGTQDTGFGGAAGAVLSRQQNGGFSDAILHLNNADPNAGTLVWQQVIAAGRTPATGSATVGADVWHHIAVVFTETNSQLYLDGLPDGVMGNGGIMRNNTLTPLAIGAWIGDGGSYATAAIDDVATWNRVLSEEEVQNLALQGRTPLDLLVAPDCLTIERSATTVTVAWESGAVLEGASEVTGPYTEVQNAVSPYESDVASAPRFFRLRSR